MIEIQNQEYWKKLFEEEIQILTPQEIEEIKNTKIKEYTSSTIWRRWYFHAREKTKTIRMEEETISMTMEEDNNQYNPIEIKDNRIYNNYVMSIESEEAKDDKEFNKRRDEIKIFKFHAESERKRSEVNNLTHQILLLKDKLSKLENKNTKEEKKKDEVTYNITESPETQIVNDLAPNVVVVDEISTSEDDLPKKES
ncbi:hypothetical protein ENUP19_0301G0011 [Entamoeba nuttalli]|uniref:BSD domain-containing protein n=1 Tax=Entamoeba nuttalli TaxID=412467 RepID=A0ABQ0DUZ8_9EUKA